MSEKTENIVNGDYQPYRLGGDLFLSGYLRFEAAFESSSSISAAVMAEGLSVVAAGVAAEEPADFVAVTVDGAGWSSVAADGAAVSSRTEAASLFKIWFNVGTVGNRKRAEASKSNPSVSKLNVIGCDGDFGNLLSFDVDGKSLKEVVRLS